MRPGLSLPYLTQGRLGWRWLEVHRAQHQPNTAGQAGAEPGGVAAVSLRVSTGGSGSRTPPGPTRAPVPAEPPFRVPGDTAAFPSAQPHGPIRAFRTGATPPTNPAGAPLPPSASPCALPVRAPARAGPAGLTRSGGRFSPAAGPMVRRAPGRVSWQAAPPRGALSIPRCSPATHDAARPLCSVSAGRRGSVCGPKPGTPPPPPSRARPHRACARRVSGRGRECSSAGGRGRRLKGDTGERVGLRHFRFAETVGKNNSPRDVVF